MKMKIILLTTIFFLVIAAEAQKSPKKINARAESEYEGNIQFQ